MKKYLSNNEYLEDTWALAAQIRNSGWRPDILIALWRGGAPVGVAVHEFFKATGWQVQHIPLKCYSYSGIGQNEGSVEFTFGGQIFGMLRAGDKVLVVDDVFDTGKTAQAIKDKISRLGIDVDMRMAMVYWKPNKNRTAIKPDYYVRNLDDQWIVFPHELEGLTEAEIAEKDPKLARLVADAVRNK
jgi:hypothetical protein